jgi:predicted O-methyltransferase YrrM
MLKNTMLKIINGGGNRTSRFHDEKGNIANLQEILTNAPKSLMSSFKLKSTGRRPYLPWIPYQVIDKLEKIICSDWKILEFGSGMSTIWLAQRCKFIHSIEDSNDWFVEVKRILDNNKITNVQLDLFDAEKYSDLSQIPNNNFDLVIVDGPNIPVRSKCLETGLSKLKPSGYLYLD